MNKILFLILALILSACTPQVTEIPTVTSRPPTETPLPTPTLHPQFIELQNFINNSGERFTLLPDGTIEEATADSGRQTIPNLHVDQNGVINIIFNNEHVRIEQSQVTFDDESGLTIEGYELNANGEWVEAVSEAMQILQTDFEKFKILPADYTVTEMEGSVEVVDTNGEIVYKNGSFEPLFLGQLIVENDICMQTEWTATKIGPTLPTVNFEGWDSQYVQLIDKAYKIYTDSRIITGFFPKSRTYYFGDGCWGNVYFNKEDQIGAWLLWKNPSGKVLYQNVFMTPKG